MKLLTTLIIIVLGVCLAILYFVQRERPGEVAFVPMSISFEDEVHSADSGQHNIGDYGIVPPDTEGFSYGG